MLSCCIITLGAQIMAARLSGKLGLLLCGLFGVFGHFGHMQVQWLARKMIFLPTSWSKIYD